MIQRLSDILKRITDDLAAKADQAFNRSAVTNTAPSNLSGTSVSDVINSDQPVVNQLNQSGDLFERVMPFVLSAEGGYVVDSGGPTMRGITLNTYKSHYKKLGLPEIKGNNIKEQMMKIITKDVAIKIYRMSYWDVPAGYAEQANLPKTAYVLFDIAVNGGVGRAKQIAATVLGGSGLADFQSYKGNDLMLANKINDLMHDFRMGLTRNNPGKYAKYKNGWTNRWKKNKSLISQI